jgi:predicted dehydrogenase
VTHATLGDTSAPVRIVLVGAGLMGHAWLVALTASDDVEVAGIVDLDLDLAKAAADEFGLTDAVVGSGLSEVAKASGAQAVVNVTVPRAHLSINSEALFAGLPVLCEKPIAPTVAEALVTAAAADASGQLLMTSQNRRYYNSLTAFRGAIDAVGEVALLTTEYAKEAHFPGFRETMPHPLLVDMAIHAFDVSRFLLGTNPVSVTCETFNPPWSWFEGDSIANALFEFEGGVRYRYTGTWTTRGLPTSWNGVWRASGSHGTATWDGETAVALEKVDSETGAATLDPALAISTGPPEEIAGSLADFLDALRTGRTPDTEVHRNAVSFAMVEAAVRSADSGERVRIDDVLADGYRAALATAPPGRALDTLETWGSASAGLALAHSVAA